MTLQQFTDSLTQTDPPQHITSALAAMWYDGKDDWEAAHNIAQYIPTRDGSWVHAYLHRKEGDQWNANYWYNRAGRTMPDLTLEAEWESIVSSMLVGK
jgi:hypothetical protein